MQNKEIVHIGLSGGGIKGVFTAAVLSVFLKVERLRPSILSGVSIGAVLGYLYAFALMGLLNWADVCNLLLNVKRNQIFKAFPLSIKGFLRGLFNYDSLGSQAGLRQILNELVSPEMHQKYLRSHIAPKVYVGYGNMDTYEVEVVCLKQLDYEDAINAILASSHVPIATELIKINGTYCADAGLNDHIISHRVLLLEGEITHNINVFTRPEKNTGRWSPSFLKIISVFQRVLGFIMKGISKDDLRFTEYICETKGIPSLNIYAPQIMKSMYDFNEERRRILFSEGVASGEQFLIANKL